MILTQDMIDLLDLFHKHQVHYALVGGLAVNVYGYTRSTQDIDLLLLPSPQNAEKVVAALEAFGFGKGGVDPSLFQSPGQVVHLGVEPNRIDLLTSLNGLDTETIFSHLNRIDLQGRICPIISLEDLLVIKKASPRLKDRADAEELEQINQALS